MRAILSAEPDTELVGEATDGEEAVALALELHPDVILMDLNMPRATGIEATRRIL
ncbi:MAG: response regulator, partial [Rubrobacteraceae bacterium]|nr:response regulator [Rubrobacteraceae bacterium]